ncbi:hypothetical protein [Catellatospora sp. TT07R-123]|uniref:hypothetical protein n=1 Tax=Catellatospora sp. TT07R-123 TaxID=2733863 RepID=UPI001BB3A2AD|nr:hypothetical protein [Catellatospora sp. TT07R-123]
MDGALPAWLVDDQVTDGDIIELCADAVVALLPRDGSRTRPAMHAVRIRQIELHGSRGWRGLFGGGDVRVDIVAVGGAATAAVPTVLSTFRFRDVGSASRLPLDDHGILVYHGRPQYFLTLAVVVSDDRGNAPDLGALLSDADTLPHVAAVGDDVDAADGLAAALNRSRTLADRAYLALRSASGTARGVYYTDRMQIDAFGAGRNPPADGQAYRCGDISLWYDVVRVEEPASGGVQLRPTLTVDLVGYSGRTEPAQRAAVRRLSALMDAVLADMHLPAGVQTQTTGDGMHLVLPPGMDYSVSLAALLDSLPRHLAADNDAHPDRLHLRAALDVGNVYDGDLVFTGNGVVNAARLVDSDPVRKAVGPEAAEVAILFSDLVYQYFLSQGYPGLDPARFTPVHAAVKAYRGLAWLWTPAVPPPDTGGGTA